jgi:SAM-dependent methyltransferase
MSVFYKALYKFGIAPWEGDPIQGPAAEQISTLFDREESSRRPPYGSALDLGCGSGIWSVRLTQRGWQVTGVDVVPKAIRKARAQAAEVNAQFVEGDVTCNRGRLGFPGPCNTSQNCGLPLSSFSTPLRRNQRLLLVILPTWFEPIELESARMRNCRGPEHGTFVDVMDLCATRARRRS